jgi:hypothetical protein
MEEENCIKQISVTAGNPTEIQTGYLENTNVERYHYTNLVDKRKDKVVPMLFFNSAQRHEGVLGKWRYSSTYSLTSALDGGERSASRPGRFTPRERAPETHLIGVWVGPRAVLDAVVKTKIPSPYWKSKRITPIVQPVAQRYTD